LLCRSRAGCLPVARGDRGGAMGAALTCGLEGQINEGCCSSACSAPGQKHPADAPEYRPKTGREELQEFREAPPGKYSDLLEEADTTDGLPHPEEPAAIDAPASSVNINASTLVAALPAGEDVSEHGTGNSGIKPRSRRWGGSGGGSGGGSDGCGGSGHSGGEAQTHEFVVLIDKSGGGRLGVDIEHQCGMMISEIHEGLVKAWNEEHPSEAVRCHDMIVGVNGIQGRPKLMAEECKKNKVLAITLRRSKDGI